MSHREPFRRALILAPLVLSILRADVNAQPRLEPLVLEPNRLKLSLLGDSGTQYVIESSTNLTDWTSLFSGASTNGRLQFIHSNAVGLPRQFYRGRKTTLSIPAIQVNPKTDPTFSTTTLIGLDGGSCFLYGPGGSRIALTIPTNTVFEAQVITMTLITNIGGLPFAHGILGAVRLEPEDIDIFGAAALEIYYPTNIDRRQIASFTCSNDGSAFRLTMDRVRSDRVLIPITHFGTYGSSLVTTQELFALTPSASPPSPVTPPSALQRFGFLNSSEQCFPERVLHALSVREAISKANTVQLVDAAVALANGRQQQLLGVPEDSAEIIARAVERACPFYDEQIAPKWAEATNNCALNTVLLQFTLAFERQLQHLGVADPAGCTHLANQPLCGGFEACLQEIKECCQQGFKGKGKVAEVLTSIRQQQLLALDCFSLGDPKVEEVIESCTTNIWMGPFLVKASYVTNEVVHFPDGATETEAFDYSMQFDGEVWESRELDFGEAGMHISLTFVGNFTVHDVHTETTRSPGQCGEFISIQKSDSFTNTFSRYVGYISVQTNGDYAFVANHLHSDEGGLVQATAINTETRTYPHCSEGTTTQTESHTNFMFFLGHGTPLPAAFGSGPYKPERFEGSTNYMSSGFGLAPTVNVQWNLFRRKVESKLP